MRCEDIRARAAGLAALPSDDAERAAAWEHARGCPACAGVLREAERLQELLSEAAPAPLRVPASERVSRLVGVLRAEERRRVTWSAAAAGAATLALVAFARHRSTEARDWILALSLAALAAGLVLAARRLGLVGPLAATVAAVAAAALAGSAGPLEAALGGHCASIEIASACAVLGAGWLAVRSGLGSPGYRFVAGTAAAGALAADAALHLTCRAHASLPHLLAFHVGGVAVAAMLAAALWRAARTEA